MFCLNKAVCWRAIALVKPEAKSIAPFILPFYLSRQISLSVAFAVILNEAILI